jgi:hypothetical protein
MSQPRRRRRRRRRSSRPSEAQGKQQSQQGKSQQPRERAERMPRRRRRGRSRTKRRTSPASSEDLVRALPKPPPKQLTAEHDGTTLEAVIGDLQSQWGVPQHPQEYRLMIKVPEEKEAASKGATLTEEVVDPPDDSEAELDGKPKREKAPAAPRIGGSEASDRPRSKRRRGRRRGRRGKGSSS